MSKKPSGLSIKRDGYKYTLSWKKGETYGDGQQLIYSYVKTTPGGSSKTVKSGTIKTSLTKRVVTIKAKYLKSITFKVRGKANNESWSAWTSYTLKLKAPQDLELKAEWNEENPNATVFKFSVEDKPDAPYEKIIWQTTRETNCPSNYKAESIWKDIPTHTMTGKSGTVYDTPESDLPSDPSSAARLVRVKAVGQGGETGWHYALHVYGKPNEAMLKEVKADNTTTGYFDASVRWSLQWDETQKPVDRIEIHYCIGIPTEYGSMPNDPDWHVVGSQQNTAEYVWQGYIGRQLDDDECLWIRVATFHDLRDAYSGAYLAASGKLAKPYGLSITPNQSTHTIQVNVTNGSQVPDSRLAILYQDPITNESAVMGIMEHGASSPVNVIVPPWTNNAGLLGVFAFTGDYEAIARADGVTVYALRTNMTSDTDWANTPQAPNLTVVKKNSDTATLTWDWPYTEAISAEISWADHDDAWQSNQGPETYVIENMHASTWNITGLEEGKVWYFRVRLFLGEGETAIYGTYSETVALDLTSTPDRPIISLTPEIIPQGEEFTVSWETSQPQEHAEIAEVIRGYEFDEYRKIASTGSDNNITLNIPYWETGTQHQIAVRYSSKNRQSEYSEPVTLTIADPLTCTIAQDSLEYDTTEINPETYEGDIVTLDGGTDNVKDVTSLTVSLSPVQAGTPAQDDTVYNEPYLEKDSPSFNSEYDKLVGASVVANQLVNIRKNWTMTQNGVTVTTDSDGKITVVVESGRTENASFRLTAENIANIKDHIVLAGEKTGAFDSYFSFGDGTYFSPFNGYMRNKYGVAKVLGNSQALDFYVGTNVPAGTYHLIYQIHDLTAYFGSATIPDRIYSMEQSQAGSGIAFLKSYDFFTKDYYPYNAGTLQSVKPTAHVTSQTYPLAGTELRGLFQLVNNKIVAYGDTQEHTGLTTHKFGIVDLGTLNWNKDVIYSNWGFYVNGGVIPNAKVGGSLYVAGNFINAKYISVPTYGHTDYSTDKVIFQKPNGQVFIVDSAYTDAATFKTAMSGVYLVYELATPTTETLTGFDSPQKVGSTESYTDNRDFPVPVGHESRYANIYPITGHDVIDTYVSPTTESEDGTTYETDLEQTVYGGDADVVNGTGTSEWANIASYNGETITEPWLSSMDVYSAGATPTTGAQVVYKLATPTDLSFTPQQVSLNSGTNNVWSDAGDVTVKVADAVESGYYLTEMPLSVTVTGAGTAGRTLLAIKRAEDYFLERPDEDESGGFEGDTIIQISQDGEDQILIERDALIGKFDDGATYRIIATITDNLGQVAEAEKLFTVRWEHQAVMAQGTAEIQDGIALIRPTMPSGALESDHVDIYRLSTDKPELLYENAAFGETYVDPHPTIGEFGGYRLVLVTANGDYITEQDTPSWIDIPAGLETLFQYIDFDGRHLIVKYNVDLDSSYQKQFTVTRYLGGRVEGHWEQGVIKNGGIKGVVPLDLDPETYEQLNRLGRYLGRCRVRTKAGANYVADIQVSENSTYNSPAHPHSITLTITKVDNVTPDGLTLADWENQ